MWTPVLGSSQLRDAPVPIVLAGEKLVLFRSERGPAALLDRCPHRGVALSLGRVREGCLECPFHGWRFDAHGEATAIPWNPDARRELLGAVSVPAAEVGGVIWVHTAPTLAPPPLPALATILARRSSSVVKEQSVRTHWSRVMENTLDAPHLPFVHRWTSGAAARAPAEAGARMDTRFSPTAWGGDIHWSVGGATTGPNQGRIRYHAPNVMQLLAPGAEGEGEGVPDQLVAVVPVDATHTRALSILAPGLSLFRVLDFFLGQRLQWEDRHVVESHDPPEVPRLGAEVSVRTDRATLAFRRLYDATFRGSWAEFPSGPASSELDALGL